MRSKHKILRTYTCSVCGKKLSSSVALASHLQIHSGIKSFCCEYCGALYSTKQNLKAHLLRKHDIDVDSIKSCDICGKQFFRKCAFDTHYLIHLKQKPFSCHICSKNFRQKITRDLHVSTHTGDYKYSCSDCGKKFLSAYKCKQHMEKKRGLCSDVFSKPRDYFEDIQTDEVVNSCELDHHVTDITRSCFNLEQAETIKFFCAMPQCSDLPFNNKTLLKKHISRAHCLNRSIDQNGIPSETLNSGIITSDKIVDQTFSNLAIQDMHSKSQNGDSSNSSGLSCTECHKQFKSLQGLQYHKKAHKGFYNLIVHVDCMNVQGVLQVGHP